MPKYSEIIGPDMQRYLNDCGIKMGRKATRAVEAASSAGIPTEDIQASILDAANRAQLNGARKIGSFGSSRPAIDQLREDARLTVYRERLGKRGRR